jgi:hypothetical protein
VRIPLSPVVEIDSAPQAIPQAAKSFSELRFRLSQTCHKLNGDIARIPHRQDFASQKIELRLKIRPISSRFCAQGASRFPNEFAIISSEQFHHAQQTRA